jgi:hypothetical protein
VPLFFILLFTNAYIYDIIALFTRGKDHGTKANDSPRRQNAGKISNHALFGWGALAKK